MKHIGIIILLMVILSSCGVTIYTTTTSGDITLLNNNGEVIRQWEESTMSVETTITSGGYTTSSDYVGTPLKNGGINFTDKNGESHYVSGGIIIIDNIKTSTEKEQIKKNTDGEIWPSSEN